MNNRTEAKLTDLSGMQKAIGEILKQAWERGRKYGQNEERTKGKFECSIKIKDLISMLLEFDMNEKATICTTDEYGENNIVISITDMRGKEE